MIKNIIDSNKEAKTNNEKIKILEQLFPDAVNDGILDFKILEKNLDSHSITKEGYELNFLGKSYAKLISAVETETVIIPDSKHNNEAQNKNSKNVYITADNLDALKHLSKSYYGKIKCVYIDPPYNTGSDGFVYKDSFNYCKEDLISKIGLSDDEAERIVNMINSESSSHSAWLTFMYPRLYLARQLLKNDGIIFISIDDNEYANLKILCDGIFGSNNMIANLIWKSKSGGANDSGFFAIDHEYILVYAKDKVGLNINFDKEATVTTVYNNRDENGVYALDRLDKQSLGYAESLDFPIMGPDGSIYIVEHKNPKQKVARWRWSEKTVTERYDELVFQNGYVYTKNYQKDGAIARSLLTEERFGRTRTGKKDTSDLFGFDLFFAPKPVKLISWLINVATNDGDIIMDFFGGSSTTAQAVMDINSKISGSRSFILVQLAELLDNTKKEHKTAMDSGFNSIDQIGMERIFLASEMMRAELGILENDIDLGFKHFTIEPIASNQLDKLEEFNSQTLFTDNGILDEFGIDTVLTTWLNYDGFGLTRTANELNLCGYIAYQIENTVYFLASLLKSEAIKCFIDKYEDDAFICDKVVLFGYSFSMDEIQTLKDNLRQIKNIKNISLDIEVRY